MSDIPFANYFSDLFSVECATEQKGPKNLTYTPWAEAWRKLKERHPDANYFYHRNNDGTLGFYDHTGGYALVDVTVDGLTHTAVLHVMDNRNNPIPADDITAKDMINTYQRCFTKAIGMHGVGLWAWLGGAASSSEVETVSSPITQEERSKIIQSIPADAEKKDVQAVWAKHGLSGDEPPEDVDVDAVIADLKSLA